MDRPAGPEPDHGPRRAGAPGQVHDPRPRLGLHLRVQCGPRRCRDPDRALQRPDSPHERHGRALDRRMPPRNPGPHPHLEPGPPAADPAPVRDPPQSAPAAPLPARRRAAETATRTVRPRPLPHPKTGSRRRPDQRISAGRMTWTKLSARTVAVRVPSRDRLLLPRPESDDLPQYPSWPAHFSWQPSLLPHTLQPGDYPPANST